MSKINLWLSIGITDAEKNVLMKLTFADNGRVTHIGKMRVNASLSYKKLDRLCVLGLLNCVVTDWGGQQTEYRYTTLGVRAIMHLMK